MIRDPELASDDAYEVEIVDTDPVPTAETEAIREEGEPMGDNFA